MVLDHEGRVIAQRLSLDVVFDVVLETLAAVEVGAAALRLRAAEQSEFHSLASLWASVCLIPANLVNWPVAVSGVGRAMRPAPARLEHPTYSVSRNGLGPVDRGATQIDRRDLPGVLDV